MESDLAQIKMLLWAILGLQVFFVVTNIACRLLGCGTKVQPDYNELLAKGKYDEIVDYTRKRLETHQFDIDALYFRATALEKLGRTESAKACVRKLANSSPRLAQMCDEWLESLEQGSPGGLNNSFKPTRGGAA